VFGRLFLGRNGIDRYSLFLIVVSLMFFSYPYVWIIGAGILGYAIFRAFSRNIEKRRMELYRFDEMIRSISRFILGIFHKVRKAFINFRNGFYKYKNRLAQRKEYLFIKCPQCKKLLRLPRKKGRLLATCPVCKTEFIKKT
jgi:phage FluMu protein Com